MTKKNIKSPREEWIEFEMTSDENCQVSIDYSVDSLGDLIKIYNLSDKPVKHVRSYKGKNKEKPLSAIGSGERLSFNQERFAFENFERIYFIDTNDSMFRNKKSCATAVYELLYFKDALVNLQGRLCFKFLIGYYQFDVLEVAKGERIGWHLFIESTRQFFEKFESDKNILLVTDHELGLHDKINSLEMPYYLNFYLPKNVKLGFAKADKSGSVLELGMKNADKMSNVIKKDFVKYLSKTLKINTLNYDNSFKGYVSVNPK